MTRKEPKNLPLSILARLKNVAREEGKAFDLILLLYFQERLLYRLSKSEFSEKFILKGGLLLFSMTNFQTRPTKDIDFLAQHTSNDSAQLENLFRKVCSIQSPDDGVIFDQNSIYSEPIAKNSLCGGVRIRMTALLDEFFKTWSCEANEWL